MWRRYWSKIGVRFTPVCWLKYPTRLMIMALGLDAVEEKAFDLVGGVEGVVLALEELVGIGLEHAANVGGIRRAALVDDIAEHQHFAGPKNVGRTPVERGPADAQADIALALRGEAANRRAIGRDR